MGSRLYVGNLAGSVRADTLLAAFSAMGEVTDVDIVTSPETGQPVGYAFVTMGSPLEAQKALSEMNGTLLDGRPLRANKAEEGQSFDG